jgi:hypothetical protein
MQSRVHSAAAYAVCLLFHWAGGTRVARTYQLDMLSVGKPTGFCVPCWHQFTDVPKVAMSAALCLFSIYPRSTPALAILWTLCRHYNPRENIKAIAALLWWCNPYSRIPGLSSSQSDLLRCMVYAHVGSLISLYWHLDLLLCSKSVSYLCWLLWSILPKMYTIPASYRWSSALHTLICNPI